MEKLMHQGAHEASAGAKPARLWVSISVAALATLAALCVAGGAHGAAVFAIPSALWLGVSFDRQAALGC